MGPLALQLKKRFTYGDYVTWNDGERRELIDRVSYNMAPVLRARHQRILGELFLHFGNWHKGKPCQVYLAPFDVRLPESDERDELVETVVQPDISIICDRSKLDEAGCRGAPDLIVEILSPGTAHIDLKIKLDRYERAGVREYWIVDPAEQTVMVFLRGSDSRYGRPQVSYKDDVVPVAILPDLEIALATVFTEQETE